MSRRVSIGLACYNRPELLRLAVSSLLAQTHPDIDILISDNASPDPRVRQTIEALAASDPRVRFVVQATNIGAAANFKYVAQNSADPYFMWASDDDVWEPEFISRCLAMLDAAPDAQMAFGTIDNINDHGHVIRSYDGFSRFTSLADRQSDAVRFVAEPEILGKANLIYGLFRTEAMSEVIATCWDTIEFGHWGGDLVFLLAFISRYPVITCDDVLLHKRVPTSSDDPFQLRAPQTYLIPAREVSAFGQRLTIAAPDRTMAVAIARAFRGRIVRAYAAASVNPAFWRAALARLAQR